MPNKQDLRFVKTERLMISTYIALRQQSEKPVKVSDLCAAAPINKATFYAHYDTMNDLHAQACRQAVSQMLTETPGSELLYTDTRRFVESVVAALQSNKALLDALFNRDKLEEINAVERCILETRLCGADSEDRKSEFLFAISGAARLLLYDQSSERIGMAVRLIRKVLQPG